VSKSKYGTIVNVTFRQAPTEGTYMFLRVRKREFETTSPFLAWTGCLGLIVFFVALPLALLASALTAALS
jgi:hypothetical protein